MDRDPYPDSLYIREDSTLSEINNIILANADFRKRLIEFQKIKKVSRGEEIQSQEVKRIVKPLP